MKAVLVFIDGTICDTRPRHHLIGKAFFYQRESLLSDQAVPGSVRCLEELSQTYQIVYLGARPGSTRPATQEWLEKQGFPKGPVFLAETQDERLALIGAMKDQFDFIAGIGDRWDDNELHRRIGCLSVILQEFSGKWDTAAQEIIGYHRKQKVRENEIHLRGKIEGLGRVCPLLLSKYGEPLWEAYFHSVVEMAESSRAARRQEELASFAEHGLDPANLRDAARWDELLREEDWESNTVYGLQDVETVEASEGRYIHKISRCRYADIWKEQGRTDIGYQIHCYTDQAWWDRPAWNPDIRFEQPKTLMQGDDCCLFILYKPGAD